MKWYLLAMKNYVTFSGRARRKEYWLFTLLNAVFSIIALLIDAAFGTEGLLYMAYMVAVFLPSLAIMVRRLHDLDKSAWWLLLFIIPIVGPLIIMIFTIMKGTEGENRFGEERPIEI